MNIYLMRHAEADTNIDGKLSHGSGGSLTERGLLQSQAIVHILHGYDIDRILCSPYARAIDTISPFADKFSMHIEIEACLAEGQLILNEPVELEEPIYENSTTDHKYPQEYETKGQFMARVGMATKLIMSNKSSNILVVTRGHMIRELINSILSLNAKLRFPHDNCGISCISIGAETTVKFINQSAVSNINLHLDCFTFSYFVKRI